MAQFDSFSPEALKFLADLKVNNTREWFADNKQTYEKHLKDPGKHFADVMAQSLRDLTGYSHDSKIFRIHRDVRFSRDKSPYNAHLHMAFTPDGLNEPPPMWFFGLSPDGLTLGCGVFQYDKDALEHFRCAMAGSMGTELERLTTDLRASGIRVAEPELKRVPAGFDKDHSNAEALRRKGFAAWIDVKDPFFATEPRLVDRTVKQLANLLPVFRLFAELA